MIIIHEDDRICVKYFSGDNSKEDLKVTFNSHISSRRLSVIDKYPLKGGWEDDIVRLNIPAIFIMEKSNIWFNIVNFDEIAIKVLQYRKEFETCTLIGASLGGYAALKFSKPLYASLVLAISPQYCIQKKNVPFENRWSEDIYKIKYYDDFLIGQETIRGDVYILVDDKHFLDNQHAQTIKKHVQSVKVIELPYSGHSSARALFDLGCINYILNSSVKNISLNILSLLYIYNRDKYFSPTVIKVVSQEMPAMDAVNFIESKISFLIGYERHKKDLEEYLNQLQASIVTL